MSRSSVRRAQVEPVAAVVAVLALCLAVAAYGAVGETVLPVQAESVPAEQVLDDAVDAASMDGGVVVSPDRLPGAVAPTGYEARVELAAADRSWTAGADDPPPTAASASQPVPVRVDSGDVRPGRLSVEVWQ